MKHKFKKNMKKTKAKTFLYNIFGTGHSWFGVLKKSLYLLLMKTFNGLKLKPDHVYLQNFPQICGNLPQHTLSKQV